jgi:hypothetical protein
MNMDGTKELADLRREFPGVWVNEHGAFLLEKPFGMKWTPPKDFVTFVGLDYGHGDVKLTLEGFRALANYIAAFDRKEGAG